MDDVRPIGSSHSPSAAFRNRFILLLAALSLLMLATPFVHVLGQHLHPRLARGFISILFVAILVSAVFAVGGSRLTTVLAVVLAAPGILLQAVDLLDVHQGIEITKLLFGVLFLGFTVVVVLHHVFTTDRVTVDTIAAALCVYLMLGVLWALVYSVMEMLSPGSLAMLSGAVEAESIRFGGTRSVLALYYSFVTMTTLGYGDIVPRSAPARMFAAMEAIMGQMYLAVLVARLVALHISQSMGRHKGSQDIV